MYHQSSKKEDSLEVPFPEFEGLELPGKKTREA